ncbi:MAG: hypothetical protein RLZZ301_1468 [Bacteroidota bacterium]|jgi:uncharacterized protein (TIGR01777 family)
MSVSEHTTATVLIAGGRGLIGGHLTRYFKERGYRVYKLTRNPKRRGHIHWNPDANEINAAKLDRIHILINLCGENIGSKRWTNKRKGQLMASRIRSTEFLASLIPQMPNLRYYIGASGVNCYDPISGKIFQESDAYGTDYLSNLVMHWEAAHDAVVAQVPGSIFRIAMVLSRHGGSLHALKIPVQLGLGAPIGTGEQYHPWIHIDDLCRMMLYACDENLKGVYHAVAANDTDKALIKSLAKWLKRPLLLPNIPGFLMRIVLGERATLVLSDLRVSNDKIKQSGFVFKYKKLDDAFKAFFKK